MEESSKGFIVTECLEHSLGRWPVLFGMGLLGALMGLIFSIMRPPLYQAEAILGVNINYGVTEPLELIIEDRTLNRVAAIIEADSTLQQVLTLVPDEERLSHGWAQPADLRKAVRLDRRLAEWRIVAVDQDPQVAAEVADIWSTVSIQVLDEAAEHAWRAVSLMGKNPFMVDCKQVPVPGSIEERFIWQCSIEPANLSPDALAGALRTEIDRSRAMFPNVSYELLQAVSVPEKPIVWARGGLVLAGAIIGLVIGFSLAMVHYKKEGASSNSET